MKKNKDILVIVESPGKIKKISGFLGSGYTVKASMGHVVDLQKGNKRYPLGVDIEHDFTPKYKIIDEKKDVVAALISAASASSKVLLGCDGDREGAAISWHLKDCLESTNVPIKRIIFNAITKSAIINAVNNPTDIDKDLFDAQQARRVLDRIVGFMASQKLRHFFGPNLSAGRVQSVAVRLIVDREREIENFKPEEYWNITAALAKPSDLQDGFVAKYANKVTNEADAKKIKADLDKDSYLIKDVVAKEKKRNPLPPLITPTLQQASGSRFGFSLSKTMRCAQALYEQGLITYMRTDSTRIEPEALDEVRNYLTSNGYKIPSNPNVYASKGSAQDAHECIRPTHTDQDPSKVFLPDDEQKVYRLIWERFVASQMEPAVYDTMTVTVESSSGHILKASGRTLKYEGWLAVATDQKKVGNSEEDVQLPVLKIKDKVVLIPPNVKAEQKFTQPPPRYGEVSLVKELEKRGIGRPSTYAAIVEKIKGRDYVEVDKKTYHPTELGKKVVDSLIKYFTFMDYQYTADMETKLDKIAEGKLSYLQMMNEFFNLFQTECQRAENLEAPDFGIVCPTCGDKTVLKHGRYGFYLACVKRPHCKGTLSVDIVDDKPVVKPPLEKKIMQGYSCPKCNAEMCRRDGPFGPYIGCTNYPRCNGSRKLPFGKKCPECGNELFVLFLGELKLGCMGYPNCKHTEPYPEDAPKDYIDPKKLAISTKKRSYKKVLNARKKKRENAK